MVGSMDNIKDIEKSEQDKYRRMYNVDSYKVNSPALRQIHILKGIAEHIKAKRILDTGCGTGRALKEFIDDGYDAIGIDITNNAHINEVDNHVLCIPIHRYKSEAYDFIYCVDVMEHIPEPLIDLTLENLSKLCGKIIYFDIALFHDPFGQIIGEELHPSIFNSNVWQEKVSKYFKIIKILGDNNKLSIICKRK